MYHSEKATITSGRIRRSTCFGRYAAPHADTARSRKPVAPFHGDHADQRPVDRLATTPRKNRCEEDGGYHSTGVPSTIPCRDHWRASCGLESALVGGLTTPLIAQKRCEVTTIERLALNAFRRRIVASSFPWFGSLSQAIAGLHFIQADPIRSPARAQDLILRHRVDAYQAGDLEQAFPQLDAEEGYLFAYGFMTPEIWQSVRKRPHRKWTKLERAVLDSVADLGQAHPRDLDARFGKKSVTNAWGGSSQQTKQVLDRLHHHGHLRVCRRDNGIRVYQHVGSPDVDPFAAKERYQQLARTTATVFGPTTQSFLLAELRSHNHLLPKRSDRQSAIDSLIEAGQLGEVEVDDVTYLWQAADWQSDEVEDRVRIVAPFDPLVRDRARFEQLWGWNYRFEAYVPAAKRQRGYYAMPVLWRDRVIGWANANTEDQCLHIEFGFADKRPRSKAFRASAEEEVDSLAVFLNMDSYSVSI